MTSKFVNPKATPYVVGDVLRFEYRVTNLTDAVTTVVPSGNLQGFDPAGGAPNCRWRNLPGNDAYTCKTAYHRVTESDLATGSFTPQTTWVSTAVSGDVTTVRLDGPAVQLGRAAARSPRRPSRQGRALCRHVAGSGGGVGPDGLA